MNPMPKGIDPLGTDADYHYRTERNYFLMVERARAAVRNHPLVEQGVNRLIANMRLGDDTLDVNSGDPAIDADQKAFWYDWCGDPKQCDYEQQRTFQQKARQSFFSQVVDGDIIHLPLAEGSLQSWESHHVRNPWGRYSTGSDQNGIIHGAEVVDGRTVAEVRDAAGHSNITITSAYLHVAVDDDDSLGNLFAQVTRSKR